MSAGSEITRLLGAWRDGDSEALHSLMPLVYDQLHRIASSYLRRERTDHTLQSTALINEAFLALSDSDVSLNDRAHFFAVAANAMRRILIDHARAASRQKRGGGMLQVTLHDDEVGDFDAASVLGLDAALDKLGALDERKSRIVEMHYFGGLNYDEIAAVLDVSAATVSRELRFSKAWMRTELGGEAT